MAMQTYSYLMWMFFLTLIVFTNFCVLNLTMAVIALAYSDVREESRATRASLTVRPSNAQTVESDVISMATTKMVKKSSTRSGQLSKYLLTVCE